MSDLTADRPYIDRPDPVPAHNSACHDPTGTLRRVITNWGFEHYMKFDQPPGRECWLSLDAYGPTDGILPDSAWRTDADMDRKADSQVVYVPLNDDAWARAHNLNPHPDPTRPEEIH